MNPQVEQKQPSAPPPPTSDSALTSLRNIVLASIGFGVLFGIYIGYTYGWEFGILASVTSGPLFGIGIYIASKPVLRKLTKQASVMPGVLLYGNANLFTGASDGGVLHLLPDRLYFKPHKLNINTKETSIYLNNIRNVKLFNAFWIIPNGLEIVTNTNTSIRFVVNRRKLWREKIEVARKNIH